MSIYVLLQLQAGYNTIRFCVFIHQCLFKITQNTNIA